MKKILFGFQTTIVLLTITTIAIIMATFIESATSTENARRLIYNATWFELVLGFLTLNVAGSMFYHHSFSWRKITVPLFHLSFVLIMVGAFFTRYTGMEGMVHIREGESSNVVMLENNGGNYRLPFDLYLDGFELLRYPGSQSPSSFSSYVTVEDHQKQKAFEYHIYMNHILLYKGWRFFQTSYDQDEKGTYLTASRDVIGTPLTYAGYFLTIVTLLLSLFMPGTFFRKQLLKLRNAAAIFVLFIALPYLGNAQNSIDPQKVVDAKQAHDFGELVIQDPKGRMKTMNTLTTQFMRKLHGNDKMNGLSGEQVVLSMMTYPEHWVYVPFIKVNNKQVRRELNMTDKYLSYAGLFNSEGRYILIDPVSTSFQKPEELRDKTDKAYLQLDDEANILHAFLMGDAIAIYAIEGAENNKWFSLNEAKYHAPSPADSLFLAHVFSLYIDALKQGKATNDYANANSYLEAIKKYQQKAGHEVILSPNKIKAELMYNRWLIFERLQNAYALSGFIMLIMFFVYIIRGKLFAKPAFRIFYIVAVVLLMATAFGIGLRWYIGGYIPISNSLEVMIFLSGIVMISGLIVSLKQPVALALSSILAYTFLFVASMNNGNPEIGNLVPVLKSYWLSIHVAVITSSYALFALVMMVGLLCLILYLVATPKTFASILEKTGQLGAVIQIMMIIALYLLTIGTILGAIWANESWGRYWGWDAKETWALISIFVYAFVAHMRFVPAMKDEFWNNLAAFWAFASILMTFFGVNYFLTGLHSYAGVGEAAVLPTWIVWTTVFFILFSIISGIRYFKLKELANS